MLDAATMKDELLKTLRETGEADALPFHNIAKALTSTLEPREVLAIVMQQISSIVRPSSWSLILQDPKTGELYFEIAVGDGAEKLKGLRLKTSEGIAGTAFTTGEAQLELDVQRAPNFSPRFDRLTGAETKNLVALPLKSRGHVLGVLELVNGLSERTRKVDLQALRAIADYAAIAIDNAHNFQRVQELTITDEHTGLFNARHLYDMLNREVDRAQRFDRPVSLVFLDLDNFKAVNDAHGHMAGSTLLRELGVMLSSAVRKVDAAFRYGGDEFALILVETDTTGALVVSHRLRKHLHQKVFLQKEGRAVRITASIGVATYPDHARSATDLLHAADRAMYKAKALGRDEIVSTSDLDALPR